MTGWTNSPQGVLVRSRERLRSTRLRQRRDGLRLVGIHVDDPRRKTGLLTCEQRALAWKKHDDRLFARENVVGAIRNVGNR
jgi:hypothetical protein